MMAITKNIVTIILFTLIGFYDQIFLIINCQSYFSNFGGSNNNNNDFNQRFNRGWQGYRSYFEQPQYQPFQLQQQQYQSFVQPQQHQSFLQTRQVSTSMLSSFQSEPIIAIAKLDGKNIDGFVEFKQMPNQMNLQISGRITGLSPGLHGFHIHQFGDTRNGCASMAGHFNPDNKNHGAPGDQQRHAGDLGNIEANQDGVAEFKINDHQISLMGPYSILGRGVVVHANQDDLGRGGHQDSLKTGNAGGRVACGIIALAANKNK